MILSVDGIEFSYPSKKVLEKIKFTVNKGEVVSILGINGAGKSTLLKCINRILRPQEGTVYIDEFDLKKLNSKKIAQKIAYVPQKTNGNNFMTVFDTVLLGRKPYIEWEASEKDLEITSNILNLMSLEKYALRNAFELSGGEFQKVIIARALVQEPRVLLLDEPANNLDLKNQLEVMELIRYIAKTKNISSLMVIHDLNLALRFSDKFIMLKDERIFSEGDNKVINSQNIREVFNVDAYVDKYNGIPIVVLA